MDIFEYVLILLAIIVGLGIAEILRCAARVLLSDSAVGPIHAVWMTTVFLHLMEVVTATWAFREKLDWSFLEILALIGPVAVLYVAAAILSAVPLDSDIDVSFLERRKPFLGLLALMMVLYSVQGWGILFAWLEVGLLPDLIRVACLVLYGALAATTSHRTHLLGAVAYLLLLVWFVVLYSPRLSDVQVLSPGS
jgi:hypothetical protein